MDVTIPAHNLRTFSSSLSALGRIGKDLYVEFDPLSGLTLRAINDAKSAYAEFHYEVGFFESYRGVPFPNRPRRDNGGSSNRNSHRSRRKKKKRRNERDKRDDRGNGDGEGGGNNSDSSGNADENDDLDEDRFVCRVPIRDAASAMKRRRGSISLRIRGTTGAGEVQQRDNHRNDDATGEGRNRDGNDRHLHGRTSTARLSFEHRIVPPDVTVGERNDGRRNDGGIGNGGGGGFRGSGGEGAGFTKVVRTVAAAEVDGLEASVPEGELSEIVSKPNILLRMLEPLLGGGSSSTGSSSGALGEVALTINDSLQVVTATSFHPVDATIAAALSSDGTNNALLGAAAASSLKTETSVGCDEFDECHWVDDRKVTVSGNANQNNDDNHASGCDVDSNGNNTNSANVGDMPPENVNTEVTLVFGIREAKAMLQFCSHSSTFDEELRVVLSFQWGGKPIMLETEGESFSAKIILATLDYELLRGIGGRNK